MIPQIENSIINETIQIINYPNKTYKTSETQIAGKTDGLEAIEQAVHHILGIERYAYLIYDDNYGVELEKYIGQDFSFLEATIEETLREALLQDDRIIDVKVTDIYESQLNEIGIDKTKLYKKIVEEDRDFLVTEEEEDFIITDRDRKWVTSSKTKTRIANVEFDVYCKQGIIHTEVKVNV